MSCSRTTTQWRRWGSNPRPFGLESSTLPLSHCAPSLSMQCRPYFFTVCQSTCYGVCLSKQCRPWWNAALCSISSGSSLFANVCNHDRVDIAFKAVEMIGSSVAVSIEFHLFKDWNSYFMLAQDIENTRWVSFDIKFTRQGFENACWHREACRAIQHSFSMPSLVNLISKDANLVFYLSVYPLFNTLKTSDYGVFFFCVKSASLATSFKKCNVIMTW